MINETEFGNYLKNLRLKAGITLREIEEQSGVSNAYLSQLENGKRGIPSPTILKKIHEPLKVTYDELMEKAGYYSSKNDISWEEMKIIEELRKYPNLYNAMIDQTEPLINKIYKVFTAFYS